MNSLFVIALYILTDLKQMLAQEVLEPQAAINTTAFTAVEAVASVIKGGVLSVSHSINADGYTLDVVSTHMLESSTPFEELEDADTSATLRNQITVVSKMANEDGVPTVIDQKVQSLMYDGRLIHINPDGVSLASVPSILKRLKPRN